MLNQLDRRLDRPIQLGQKPGCQRNLRFLNLLVNNLNLSSPRKNQQQKQALMKAQRKFRDDMNHFMSNDRYIILSWISEVYQKFTFKGSDFRQVFENLLDEERIYNLLHHGRFVRQISFDIDNLKDQGQTSGKIQKPHFDLIKEFEDSEYNVIKYSIVHIVNLERDTKISSAIREDAITSILESITHILDTTDEKADQEELKEFFLYDPKTRSSQLLDYAESKSVKSFYHLMAHRATNRYLDAIKMDIFNSDLTYDRYDIFNDPNKDYWENKILKKNPANLSGILLFSFLAVFYPILTIISCFVHLPIGQRCRRFISAHPYSAFCAWMAKIYLLLCLYVLAKFGRDHGQIFYCCRKEDHDHNFGGPFNMPVCFFRAWELVDLPVFTNITEKTAGGVPIEYRYCVGGSPASFSFRGAVG